MTGRSLAVALVLVLAAAQARADDDTAPLSGDDDTVQLHGDDDIALEAAWTHADDQPARSGSFDFSIAPYQPNIDAEFDGRASPYKTIFGSSVNFMYRFGFSKSWYLDLGTLDASLRVGYFSVSGNGILASTATSATPTPSQDPTGLNIVPTSVSLGYRFDSVPENLHFPIAPYFRVSLDRYNWWVTGGSGGTVARGATNGFSGTFGLALLLDWFDENLARDFDRDIGVHHTYLTADVSETKINNFGSKTSWDLSNARPMFSFGILVVY